jgi:hypothetical protein
MTVNKYVLDINNAQKLNIHPKRVATVENSAFFFIKNLSIIGFFLSGNLPAVIAQRFVNSSISVNVPRLQILIYPVVQFFDFMVPSYLTA